MSSQSNNSRGSPEPQAVLRAHELEVSCVKFTPDASMLLSGDALGRVVVWKLSTRRSVADRAAHKRGVLALAQHDSRVMTHGRDGVVQIWDWQNFAADDAVVPTTSVNTESYTFCAAHWPGGSLIATPSQHQSRLAVHDLRDASFSAAALLAPTEAATNAGMAMCVRIVDDELVVATHEDGKVRVWDIRMTGTGYGPSFPRCMGYLFGFFIHSINH